EQKQDKNSSDTRSMRKRRIPARYLDGGDGPFLKTVKSEPVEKQEKKKRSSSKGPAQLKLVKSENPEKNELDCPICENYSTRSVAGWDWHLKSRHSTTTLQAGYVLRCDCGHECYSAKHSRECDVANFTLLPKQQKMTPMCISCEKYPSTASGYYQHLSKHHKTSLAKNGLFLLCACGFKCTSRDNWKNHDNKCAGNDFTLHELDEE
ncbi:hypothetical protein PMAYCL1PPCAC_26884, partial [Pristionchus mayeri]